MKIVKYGLLLSSLYFLSGCATSGKLNNVSIGISKEEVVTAMGNPVSVSAQGGIEYLNYRLSETHDNAVRGWTTPYYVRLVKGKVDSFGRAGDFDSTKTPTIKIQKDENVNVQNSSDLYSELKKLQGLRDDGIITEEEFQTQKKRIVNKY